MPPPASEAQPLGLSLPWRASELPPCHPAPTRSPLSASSPVLMGLCQICRETAQLGAARTGRVVCKVSKTAQSRSACLFHRCLKIPRKSSQQRPVLASMPACTLPCPNQSETQLWEVGHLAFPERLLPAHQTRILSCL